jgi:L-fucose isomerase-like protein
MAGGAAFLMYQDSPGEGMQASIFKRFYWWEEECTRQIERAFGIRLLYRSWKELNERARAIPDAQVEAVWARYTVPSQGVPMTCILKAAKIYLAVKADLQALGDVVAVGANCLNESFHADSVPCLAWNWLFEHDRVMWVCEGDTVSLISQYILYSALQKPLMTTNIYPFLVGMAALKHERIDAFPQIQDPDNHALGVHCGYMGLAPQSFCTEWVLRPKVLAIVNDDAVMVDCRLAKGPVTMAKLQADMKKLTVIEAEIEDYVQYPGSDCRNGALIRYRNNSGHRVMESLSSHHAILVAGDVTPQLLQLAKVYGFEAQVI